jgi:hypothetical protein
MPVSILFWSKQRLFKHNPPVLASRDLRMTSAAGLSFLQDC